MNSKFKIISLAAALCTAMMATPAIAQASDTILYAESGDWNVYQRSGQCYMIGRYGEDEETLSIFMDSFDQATFWIQHADWKSIRDGSSLDIKVEFDDFGEWDITAKGRSDADGPGISWSGNIEPDENEDSFFGEFMASKSMAIIYRGRLVTKLSMEGSYKASMEMGRCLAKANVTSPDPFAN